MTPSIFSSVARLSRGTASKFAQPTVIRVGPSAGSSGRRERCSRRRGTPRHGEPRRRHPRAARSAACAQVLNCGTTSSPRRRICSRASSGATPGTCTRRFTQSQPAVSIASSRPAATVSCRRLRVVRPASVLACRWRIAPVDVELAGDAFDGGSPIHARRMSTHGPGPPAPVGVRQLAASLRCRQRVEMMPMPIRAACRAAVSSRRAHHRNGMVGTARDRGVACQRPRRRRR